MAQSKSLRQAFLGTAALVALTTAAEAQTREFSIPAEDLKTALNAYIAQSGVQLLYVSKDILGKRSHSLQGRFSPETALDRLLEDTNVRAERDASGAVIVSLQKAADITPPEQPDSLASLANQAAAVEKSPAIEFVVVSASRLSAKGFNAPTPIITIGTRTLEQSAKANIFNTVAELPELQGSRSTSVGNGNTSDGLNGLSAFSIRGLAAIRTLTLIDGERIAPANVTGVVDVSLLPQLLIQRVEVVTGGASTSYGSDAIGGVVNFITDLKFRGFKANLQGGITKYGDDGQFVTQMAWGDQLFSGRAHFTISGEYYRNAGVPSRPPGQNGGPNGRSWFQLPQVVTRTISATPAGQPQLNFYLNAQNRTFSAGGLITAGPLTGTAFGVGGSPYQFQYGASCIGTFCQGGDNSASVLLTSSLDDAFQRAVGSLRFSYDIAPGINLFATASYAEIKSINQTNAGAPQQANLTIQCDNAFLPASITSACSAANISNFGFGVSNEIYPSNVHVEINRKQPRYVLGLNATELSLLGISWTIQGYYEHAQTQVAVDIHNVQLTNRYLAAIDAIKVTAANQANYSGATIGTIVCRNAMAQASGCVPLNIIGINPVDPTALSYVEPAHGPQDRSFEREEDVSLSFEGTPFKNWAGPVGLAFGAEWREEAYNAAADWYGAGISAKSPVNQRFPNDPILSTSGANWYAGNFNNGQGQYDVTEAFAEIGMPLFDRESLGKFDLNLAGRFTYYSTSGAISTWKLGGVWDTPITGVRLRAVLSRDVRAPNLSELFSATISQNATVTDRTNGNPVNVIQSIISNPNLSPEQSNNLEFGAVFHPVWLPDLNVSLDYYDVRIHGAISTLGGQAIVDLCQIADSPTACSDIRLTGSLGGPNPPFVIIQPFNLASIWTNGFDVAASFGFEAANLVPGHFVLDARATHVNNFVSNTGVPNSAVAHYAGNNSGNGGGYDGGDFGNTPKWKALLTQSWDWQTLTLSLSERLISAGYINANWVQCNPGTCPVATIQHPTVNYNHVSGAVYLDAGGSYKLTQEIQAYLKVENMFDVSPPPYGHLGLYDYLGRTYRIGVRVDTGNH
jgi:outer membrane receptor protein involved in Fe transport